MRRQDKEKIEERVARKYPKIKHNIHVIDLVASYRHGGKGRFCSELNKVLKIYGYSTPKEMSDIHKLKQDILNDEVE